MANLDQADLAPLLAAILLSKGNIMEEQPGVNADRIIQRAVAHANTIYRAAGP